MAEIEESGIKNDFFYAEMIRMMRAQGSKDNPVILQLGVMQSSNSVKVDDLMLNAEDLYIADYLISGYTRQIKVPYVSDVRIVDHSPILTRQSKITYTDGLKKGDLVAVQKLNATNKYVILARVKGA